ncbi:diacylglycerol kinase [Aliirhizobium smilacinae]|nr:diacylglycerol kinase [Rhizobium smilacinae]
MSGARYLLREQAARHEIWMVITASISFGVVRASFAEHLTLIALFILVVCVEAINTAGEAIVDHVSPEISEFAKRVKDLLSFAVFCTLLLFGGFTLSVLFSAQDLQLGMDMSRVLPVETPPSPNNLGHSDNRLA